MKRITFFIIVCVVLSFNVSAQNSKSFDVEFLLNGKKITNVQYYYINQDTAYKLPYFNDKLTFENDILKQKYFKMAAVFGKKMFSFRLETEDFFYIKIEGYREGLKMIYRVNHGSEYDEIVKPMSLDKLIFKDK
nr:hypothetical protein [uncultured Mucilaginibacter sp.]